MPTTPCEPRVLRRSAVALLLLVPVAACSDESPAPSGDPEPTGQAVHAPDVVRGLTRLLDRRADAVRDDDQDAFLAGVDAVRRRLPRRPADLLRQPRAAAGGRVRLHDRPGEPHPRRPVLLGRRRRHPRARRVRRGARRDPGPLPVLPAAGPLPPGIGQRPDLGGHARRPDPAVGRRAGRRPLRQRRARHLRPRQRGPRRRRGRRRRDRSRRRRGPRALRLGSSRRPLRALGPGVPRRSGGAAR